MQGLRSEMGIATKEYIFLLISYGVEHGLDVKCQFAPFSKNFLSCLREISREDWLMRQFDFVDY